MGLPAGLPVRGVAQSADPAAGGILNPNDGVLVAIGEATTNCIRHAYNGEQGHEVRVTYEDAPDKIVIRIRDFGKKIDADQLEEKLEKPPELPPTKPYGLGLYFMKTIMDNFEYNTSHPEGNEIILTKFKENVKGSES